MATPLGNQALGSIVTIRESGTLQEFIVARHNAYATGRTLLVRRHIFGNRQWHTANINAYATSAIDVWLSNTYIGLLPADIQAQITAVSIPFTPGNGNNTLGTLSRRVFLLSGTELGRSHAQLNLEGTVLDIASQLQIATNAAGTAQQHWTRSPFIGDTTNAWFLLTNGGLGSGTSGTRGARPAFTLPSSLSISDSGEVLVNTPPVINFSGSTDLGNLTDGTEVTYSVSDADGDTVTVTERLNNVIRRTHTPALGAAQTFEAVLPQNFQTILNGNHTLRIEATDGQAPATPVSITFTKSVFSCSITLSAPLPADDMPTAIRLAISGNIPDDAVWTAEVCNNGNDAAPAWENIRPAIGGGFNHAFANTSKTAAVWGINFRLTFARGPSNTGGYIHAIEGGFQ